jgi:hypothetical protein
MHDDGRRRVVLVPGGVMPAEPAYATQREALGPRVETIAQGHVLYTGEEPPSDWSLEQEAKAILDATDARGFERFRLVGVQYVPTHVSTMW